MNLDSMYTKEKLDLAKSTTDPEVLEQLSKDEDEDVRLVVAGNKNCYPHVLEELSKDDYKNVRRAVANNENSPLSALLRLFIDFYVKSHPNYINCDLNELLSYVDHEDPSFRTGVASHPKCPPDILEDPLSTDSYWVVRWGVAAHPNCPPHVLEKPLSTDDNSSVREAVALNPNCPDQALINICDDPNKYVRDAVLDNPRSFGIPQIAEKLKAFNKKTINEYTKTKIPKNLNSPSHLHKSINTDLELLLALHKYLMRGN